MKTIEINGSVRESLGKKASKKSRANQLVPCVLYGGKENIHFEALESEFRSVIFSPNSYLLKLNISGKTYDAIIKDTQYHPVSDELIHADFFEISQENKIITTVPVQLNGFAKGVKAGGKLHLLIRKLKIKALPKDLPDILEINIENLELGKTIKINDLSFPNVELLDPKNSVVVAIRLTRVAKSAAEGEAAAATEEKKE